LEALDFKSPRGSLPQSKDLMLGNESKRLVGSKPSISYPQPQRRIGLTPSSLIYTCGVYVKRIRLFEIIYTDSNIFSFALQFLVRLYEQSINIKL
jgi:hypothetical protein